MFFNIWGMNIHEQKLFWGEQKGIMKLYETQIDHAQEGKQVLGPL